MCFIISIILAFKHIEPPLLLHIGGVGFIIIAVLGLNKDKER
jgi:hypothetical protein